MKKKNLIAAIFIFGCMAQAFASGQVITNCEAGMLSVLLKPEDAAVTMNLTISGEMDARDFRYLQDSFPVIRRLDIENVKIVSYQGKSGTLWCTDRKNQREDCTLDRLYPEDELPEWAFSNWYNQDRIAIYCIILPKSLRSIGEQAFSNLVPLSLIMPDDITLDSIGMRAFSMTDLDTIVLPASVTSLGLHMFWKCDKLEYADFSETQITFLPQLTFGDCSSLKKVLLPATLDSISHQAFQIVGGCLLDTIVMYSPVPPKYPTTAPYTVPFMIDFGDKEVILEVPEGTQEAYINAGYGQWFAVVEMGKESTSISIAESFSGEIIIYPNPVEDILYIKLPEGSAAKGFLTDSSGRKTGIVSASKPSINMADYPAGLYFLQIETEKGITVQKIIKK